MTALRDEYNIKCPSCGQTSKGFGFTVKKGNISRINPLTGLHEPEPIHSLYLQCNTCGVLVNDTLKLKTTPKQKSTKIVQ